MKNNLISLIEKYGEPDALIDHWSKNNTGYAIWGFKDTITLQNSSDMKSKKNDLSLAILQKTLDQWKKNDSEISAIGFINYNFKDILYKHISFKNNNLKFPYLFFGQPQIVKKYKIESNSAIATSIKIKKDFENFKQYEKKINRIKSELKKGNVYQINYTNNKSYIINSSPLELYLYLRNKVKPKYGYYIKYNNMNILSFSPELFFETKNNKIYTSPMKGTRKRSNNIEQDNKLKFELKNSIKDRAEHLMIVDLLRNDLGKISIPGTIRVNEIFKVESHPKVHQMISNIQGEIDDSINIIDILEALFPGGSITGAPKESAMKIIDELENYSRDLYTGSIGYIKSNGDSNFNISIRTMTIKGKQAVYPVGGGIVWDSNALDEWNEALLKSEILNFAMK